MQCLGALLYFENGPTSKTGAIIAAISGLDCTGLTQPLWVHSLWNRRCSSRSALAAS